MRASISSSGQIFPFLKFSPLLHGSLCSISIRTCSSNSFHSSYWYLSYKSISVPMLDNTQLACHTEYGDVLILFPASLRVSGAFIQHILLCGWQSQISTKYCQLASISRYTSHGSSFKVSRYLSSSIIIGAFSTHTPNRKYRRC
jgi:hypothetical protein